MYKNYYKMREAKEYKNGFNWENVKIEITHLELNLFVMNIKVYNIKKKFTNLECVL